VDRLYVVDNSGVGARVSLVSGRSGLSAGSLGKEIASNSRQAKVVSAQVIT
jgi:hypothetical protein